MDKLIITVSSSGGKWTGKDSPYLPLNPSQIIEDILRGYDAGATIAHIHARDEDGQPSFDPKYFAKIVEGVRKRSPMLIQISTGFMEGQVEEKMVPLFKLKPNMASLNIKGPIDEVRKAAETMKHHGIKPVTEAFSVSMIRETETFIEKGILEPPVFYEVVFDLERKSPVPMIADVEELISRVKAMVGDKVWSTTRGADNQFGLGTVAILLGGHVRVGLEDNLYFNPGALAKSGHEFVQRIAQNAASLGRPLANVEETKKILRID